MFVPDKKGQRGRYPYCLYGFRDSILLNSIEKITGDPNEAKFWPHLIHIWKGIYEENNTIIKQSRLLSNSVTLKAFKELISRMQLISVLFT